MTSSGFTGLFIAFAYGVCSASMTFINKALLTTYSFDFPTFLVATQMIATILILELLRFSSILQFKEYTMERGKGFLIPSVFYALNSVLALWALSGMNVAMYGTLKRCAPLFILILGPTMFHKPRPQLKIVCSVAFMSLGFVIAGAHCWVIPSSSPDLSVASGGRARDDLTSFPINNPPPHHFCLSL